MMKLPPLFQEQHVCGASTNSSPVALRVANKGWDKSRSAGLQHHWLKLIKIFKFLLFQSS